MCPGYKIAPKKAKKARKQNIDRTPKRSGRYSTEVKEPKRNKDNEMEIYAKVY